MAVSLQQRIDKIKSKAALLSERNKALSEACRAAEARIADLEEANEKLLRQVRDRDREIERLKVASVLSPDHKDVEQARQFISSLVRDIDKCIAQLSV
ncbi:MAG: hypothetical protein HFJ91_04475 [Muribaculaceae bacterium]|nr:hypothetical protein [Muribaculaceae bacterium]